MDVSKILESTDDRLFNYCISGTFRAFNSEDPKYKDKLEWYLLGLLIVIATEPMKLVLRENIGKLSFSFHRLLAACVLYFLYGLMLLALFCTISFYESHSKYYLWWNSYAVLVAASFYMIFPIVILIKGMRERATGFEQEKSVPDAAYLIYRGDSYFFKKALKDGVEPKVVWAKREPAICLAISVVATVANPFLGLPLLCTSISFAFNEWMQVNNIFGSLDERIAKAQKLIANRPKKAAAPKAQGVKALPFVRSH